MFIPPAEVETARRNGRSRSDYRQQDWVTIHPNHLNAAFQLAHFIHGDRQLAIRIATESVELVEIARCAQDKRLYYTPSGFCGSKTQPLRTKVSVSAMPLLQRLTFAASERYEKEQEEEAPGKGLTERDLIVRYVEHLVRITTRRNSFYVTLGLSRLLHSYTTAEAMTLYNVVVQDPGRVKEDSYWRDRKRQLMNELESRFGRFLTRARGPRGEERFETCDDSERWTEVVTQCLGRFTPWGSECVVPDKFNPQYDELDALASDSADPDGEHSVEVSRMHSVIDPDCYRRLARALRIDKPEARLQVPRFAVAHDGGTGNGHRDWRPAPNLTDDEIAGMWRDLEHRAARRKKISARCLSVVVDGADAGQLDLKSGSPLGLELSDAPELIEVRARDKEGEVNLIALPMNYTLEGCGHKVVERRAEGSGGQRISFKVSLNTDSYGERGQGCSIEIDHQETHLISAASLYLSRAARAYFGATSTEAEERSGDGSWSSGPAFGNACAEESSGYGEETRGSSDVVLGVTRRSRSVRRSKCGLDLLYDRAADADGVVSNFREMIDLSRKRSMKCGVSDRTDKLRNPLSNNMN